MKSALRMFIAMKASMLLESYQVHDSRFPLIVWEDLYQENNTQTNVYISYISYIMSYIYLQFISEIDKSM